MIGLRNAIIYGCFFDSCSQLFLACQVIAELIERATETLLQKKISAVPVQLFDPIT